MSQPLLLCDDSNVSVRLAASSYTFGRGYASDTEVQLDYVGLAHLIRETKAALAQRDGTVTMAYYPDRCYHRDYH